MTVLKPGVAWVETADRNREVSGAVTVIHADLEVGIAEAYCGFTLDKVGGRTGDGDGLRCFPATPESEEMLTISSAPCDTQ